MRYAGNYLHTRIVSQPDDLDPVFRALADPTRRRLLDALRRDNGQRLGDLCEGIAMTRQSVTQHLDLLVEAGLVVVVRRGRERRHYLDPTPIHRIERRWLGDYDRLHLGVIDAITERAEARATPHTEEHDMPTKRFPTSSTSPTSRRARNRCGMR